MRFDSELVLEGVAETRFRGSVRHFAVTGSTNTLALEAAAGGAMDGVWVADEQTAGRGRGGHGWHSAAGEGLYCSALVRPRLAMADAMVLPLVVGLAAAAAVEEVSGMVVDLRWPNDLLLGGDVMGGRRVGAKKFGGILVETSGAEEDGGVRFAVIGVGINVNHRGFPEELRGVATSLRIEGDGAEVAREEVLVAFLRRLEMELQGVELPGGMAAAMARFGAASSWVEGKRVRVGDGVDSYVGVTCGLTKHGFLRVAGEDGQERTVVSGGVREIIE